MICVNQNRRRVTFYGKKRKREYIQMRLEKKLIIILYKMLSIKYTERARTWFKPVEVHLEKQKVVMPCENVSRNN